MKQLARASVGHVVDFTLACFFCGGHSEAQWLWPFVLKDSRDKQSVMEFAHLGCLMRETVGQVTHSENDGRVCVIEMDKPGVPVKSLPEWFVQSGYWTHLER